MPAFTITPLVGSIILKNLQYQVGIHHNNGNQLFVMQMSEAFAPVGKLGFPVTR
jgi:hypothetical protein